MSTARSSARCCSRCGRQRVRQRPVVERWHELKRTQWLSPTSCTRSSSTSSRGCSRHAYEHVPFYRARFDAVGRDARDDGARRSCRSCGAPSCSARVTRGHRRSPPLPTIRKQTSGTTGEPLLFGYEPDSEHWRRAVKLRGYDWAGYRPGDRALHFWGAPIADGSRRGRRASRSRSIAACTATSTSPAR